MFKRKSLKQRFCKQQCRVNFHTRANYRKKNPIVRTRRICPECGDLFVIDSRARGPKKKFCCHNCKSRYGMRRQRSKKQEGPQLHEVISDGVTVWVNGAENCLGRFGVNGIDIHKELSKSHGGNECLFCTHAPTTRVEWDLFVVKMLEFYKIPIHDRFMPKRFR